MVECGEHHVALIDRAPWARTRLEAARGDAPRLAALTFRTADGQRLGLGDLASELEARRLLRLASAGGTGFPDLLTAIAADHAAACLSDAVPGRLCETPRLPLLLAGGALDGVDSVAAAGETIVAALGAPGAETLELPLVILSPDSLDERGRGLVSVAGSDVVLLCRAAPEAAGSLAVEPLTAGAATAWLAQLAPEPAPLLAVLVRWGLEELLQRPGWVAALAELAAGRTPAHPAETLRRWYLQLAGDGAVPIEPALRSIALTGSVRQEDLLLVLAPLVGHAHARQALERCLAAGILDADPDAGVSLASSALADLFRGDELRRDWEAERRLPAAVRQDPAGWTRPLTLLLAADPASRLSDEWLRDAGPGGAPALLTALVRAGRHDQVLAVALAAVAAGAGREAIAGSLLALGLPDAASDLLRDLSTLRGGDRGLQARYAAVLARSGRHGDAASLWASLAAQPVEPVSAAIAAAELTGGDFDDIRRRLGRLAAELALAEARRALGRDDLAAARAAAERASEADPDSAAAWLLCAEIAQRLGHWEAARIAGHHARDHGAEPRRLLLLEAGLLEAAADPAGAASLLLAGLAVEPDAAQLHSAAARLLRIAQAPLLALPHARRATELEPVGPAGWIELGSLLEETGDSEGALDAWRRAVDSAPADAGTVGRLAGLLRARGDLAAAEALLERAAAAEPRVARWHQQLGVLALDQDQPDIAVVHFERAIALEPDDAMTRRNLADALARAGQDAAALEMLERVLQLTANDPAVRQRVIAADALTLRARLLDAAGRYDEAIADWQAAAALEPDAAGWQPPAAAASGDGLPPWLRAVEQRPDDPVARLELGRAQLRAGNEADAIDQFRRSLALRPASRDVRIELGRSLRRSGDLGDAIAVLSDAAAGRDPAIRHELGLAHEQAGQLDAALAAYREAVRDDVQNAELWLAIGRVARRSGNASDALVALRTAVSLDPASSASRLEIALALQQFGRYEEALAQLDAALAIAPDEAPLHYQRAVTLRRLLRDGEAVSALQRAVDLEPASSAWQAELGRLFERLGRHDEAVHQLQAAAGAANAADMATLGGLHQRRGDSEGAATALQRALELDPGNDPVRLQLARAQLEAGLPDDAAATLASIDPQSLTTGERAALAAGIAEQQGDLATARAELDQAVAADPGRPEWLRQLSGVCLRLGDLPAAETALRRALAIDSNPALYRDLAVVLLQAGQPDAAAGLLQRALLEGRDLPAAQRGRWRLELGDALAADGQPRPAEAEFELARELGVAHADVDLRLARLALQRGAPADALRFLDRAGRSDDLETRVAALAAAERHAEVSGLLEAVPPAQRSPGMLRALARAAAAAGRTAEAITQARLLLEREPGSASDHRLLAGWLLAEGDRVGAEIELRTAVQRDPADPDARLAAGRFFLEADDTAAAHLHLAAAADARRDDPAIQAGLAQVLERLGQLDAATSAWEAAHRLGAGTPAALALARLLVRRGLAPEASRYARRVVESEPNNAAAWALLGDALGAAGDQRDAAQAYRQATRLDPDDAALTARAGLALAAVGEDRAAIQLLEKAAELDTDPARWLEAAGDLLLERHRYDEALDHFRRAAAHGPAAPGLLARLAALESASDPGAAARLEALLRDHPRDPLVAFAAATARPARGHDDDPDRRLDWLRRAWALAPDRPHIGLTLAEQLRERGRVAETITALETTRDLPLSVAQRLRRADVWRAVQHWNEAIDDLAAAQRASDDGFLALRRAQFLRDAGRAREALAVVTQAVAADAPTPPLEGLRAELLLDLGETEGAIEAIERALRRDPRPEHFLILASALERTGRFEAARQAVRTAADHGADPADSARHLASIDARFTIERQRRR